MLSIKIAACRNTTLQFINLEILLLNSCVVFEKHILLHFLPWCPHIKSVKIFLSSLKTNLSINISIKLLAFFKDSKADVLECPWSDKNGLKSLVLLHS